MAHSWDDRGWGDQGDLDEDNLIDWNWKFEPDPDDNGDPDCEEEWQPAHEFLNLVIRLLLYSSISATTFCLIMYWAARAGIKEAEKYGLRPGCQSGKYGAKVKSIFGWRSKKNSSMR